MKITNPGSEIARKMSNERHKDLDEVINRIKHKNLTRSSIVDEYFPTAITDEVMSNPVYENPKKFYSGEITMSKIRFGDLKKDDIFEFAGKQMKKLSDEGLHATTLSDRGKESFMFFKHNLVNVESVVDNNNVNELDCFYAPYIPVCKTLFINCSSSEEPGTTFISDSDEEIEQKYNLIISNTRLETETINYFGTEIIQHNIYKTDLGTISYDCNPYDHNKPYDSCFPDSIESLLNPRNSLSEPGTIFLDVQPVSEDYVQTLLKPYTVKTNSILSDHDKKSLTMIA